MRALKTISAAVAALTVALPAVAAAHRPATQAERQAIRTAVVRQHQLTTAQAGCQAITISTAASGWAELAWPAKLSKACATVAADGVILEHSVGGSWRFVTVGSDLPCPIKGMPTAVERDLAACRPVAAA